jgi:hypothetical protein
LIARSKDRPWLLVLLLASREPSGAQLPLSSEIGERHNCFSNKTADPQLIQPQTYSATPNRKNHG